MKNKKRALLALLVLVAIAIGILASPLAEKFGLASIINESQLAKIEFIYGDLDDLSGRFAAPSEALNIQTTSVAPKYPYNFNLFENFKSKLALLAIHKDNIEGVTQAFFEEYEEEIISFVVRISQNSNLSNKLPMYPMVNQTTVGGLLAYLLSSEQNPLLAGMAIGLVPLDAVSRTYMSKYQVRVIAEKVYGEDVTATLVKRGIINAAEWSDKSRDGFLLVDAIRLMLQHNDVIEQANIIKAKAQYEKDLVDLGEGGLLLDRNTLVVVAYALEKERNPGKANAKASVELGQVLTDLFEPRYGIPLTAELIVEIRNAFYKSHGETPPPVYQLQDLTLAGRCDNQLHRKTYMGSVAVTGENGAIIICDQLLVHIPANAFVINFFNMPKITQYHHEDFAGKGVFSMEVMRSYENSFAVTSEGEQKVTVVGRSSNIEKLQGERFAVAIGNQDGKKIKTFEGDYLDLGAVIRLHLRKFSGDHLIYFDPKL